jgi:hypothetical protein
MELLKQLVVVWNGFVTPVSYKDKYKLKVRHEKHEGEHTDLKGPMHVDRSDDTCIMMQIATCVEMFQETSLNVMVAIHIFVPHTNGLP